MGHLLLVFLLALFTITETQACEGVEIVSRTSWGGREPRTGRTALSVPVSHVIVAHTVTPQCNDAASCAARMRGMQDYHMDRLGWSDIGYNFVIGGDGRAYEGAGWLLEGTHTYGWNAKSLGVAFVGDFTTAVPSAAMLTAGRKLIVCGIQMGYVSGQRQVHGARDATCTASPGDRLYDAIRAWPCFVAGPLPGYTCKGQ